MTDTNKKPTEGFFKIEQFDIDGNLVDSYEDQNMIMRDSKTTVASLVSGKYPTNVSHMYINKFVLGNRGSIAGDILSPKTFSYERTKLFADEENAVLYPITWEPTTADGAGIVDVTSEGSPSSPSTVNDTVVRVNIQNGSTVVYEIDISVANANGSANTGAIAWTEAGLYTAETTTNPLGKIFAMRTFPAKVKESTTNFKITWKIIF